MTDRVAKGIVIRRKRTIHRPPVIFCPRKIHQFTANPAKFTFPLYYSGNPLYYPGKNVEIQDMKAKTLLLCLSLAGAGGTTAQTTAAVREPAPAQTPSPAKSPAADFGRFVARQDSLFLVAYRQKDVGRFQQLLLEYKARYEALDTTGKKTFAPSYRIAWYNLSCTYGVVRRDSEALDALEKAVKLGYSDYSNLVKDDDLAGIRDSARFRRIAAQLRETGDYLYILSKAGEYNPQDQRPLPAFEYAPPKDSALAALRKGLKLDSIAGGGADVTRVLRLLHWMHDLVPHDGNQDNPAVKNAMSLIAVCRRENRGLNCRGLAIALNECYLALGYPSRYVTCLPKDSLHVDPDCHVINQVYLRSLKKWVWIDPTNDAYVMDEHGQLLNIEEVRQRLIDHRPLIVNPDANWNHKSAVLKNDYLYNYMAKNLYILQCPVTSGYDLETKAQDKTYAYIELIPLDYFRQGPDKEEEKRPMNGRYINYHTNNAAKFWAAPD